MTQKEKLIELMLRASMDMFNIQTESIEIVAEYLLDNGVVVLPCKVGDTVYQVGRDFCDKRNHGKCDVYCDGWDDLCPENNGDWIVETRVFTMGLFNAIGKTIFLTREEAEDTLATLERTNKQ